MQRPLHIAISGRALSLPFGGVREFLDATLRALLSQGSPHRFTIYYDRAGFVGRFPAAREVVLAAPHKLAWDHAVLPLRLAHDRPDVVWFPHNVASIGLRVPSVVTVHDLLYFRMPEVPWREYALLDTLYMRTFIPPSVRRASRVITDSHWTARDLARLCGVQGEKVAVVHLAVDPELRPAGADALARVRGTYRLERPYFLYVGTRSPRKNVRALVEAFRLVAGDLPHDLVLVGGRTPVEQPLDDLLACSVLAGRVRQLGLVPRSELSALYGAAEAFVFPSLYEGFGIPPLEAMACGCPVICSSATSLPEVVGDAALTFDPRDAQGLAALLRRVAGDDGLRRALAEAGPGRAARFSYRQAAADVLSLLEAAAREAQPTLSPDATTPQRGVQP